MSRPPAWIGIRVKHEPPRRRGRFGGGRSGRSGRSGKSRGSPIFFDAILLSCRLGNRLLRRLPPGRGGSNGGVGGALLAR